MHKKCLPQLTKNYTFRLHFHDVPLLLKKLIIRNGNIVTLLCLNQINAAKSVLKRTGNNKQQLGLRRPVNSICFKSTVSVQYLNPIQNEAENLKWTLTLNETKQKKYRIN